MKIKVITISKLLFFLYVLYDQLIKINLFSIPRLSQILVFSAFGLCLLENRVLHQLKDIIWYLLFCLIIFLTSQIIAVDSQLALTYSALFFQYTIVMLLIFIYVKNDSNLDFVMNTFLVLCIFMSITLLLRGVTSDYNRNSIAENVNSNSVGVSLMFGVGIVLYKTIGTKRNDKSFFFRIAIIFLMILCVLLTVSKKSIIGCGILLTGWILFCYNQTFDSVSPIKRLGITSLLLIIGTSGYIWFSNKYGSRLDFIFSRMDEIGTGTSSLVRLQLIDEGFNVFLNHPILGVGFNNFRYYTQFNTYSHCFYIELLACTGLIGTFFFIKPMIQCLFGYIRKIFYSVKIRQIDLYHTQTIFMLIIYITLLFIGFTQIIFYAFNLVYILSMCLAYYRYLDDMKKEKGE